MFWVYLLTCSLCMQTKRGRFFVWVWPQLNPQHYFTEESLRHVTITSAWRLSTRPCHSSSLSPNWANFMVWRADGGRLNVVTGDIKGCVFGGGWNVGGCSPGSSSPVTIRVVGLLQFSNESRREMAWLVTALCGGQLHRSETVMWLVF